MMPTSGILSFPRALSAAQEVQGDRLRAHDHVGPVLLDHPRAVLRALKRLNISRTSRVASSMTGVVVDGFPELRRVLQDVQVELRDDPPEDRVRVGDGVDPLRVHAGVHAAERDHHRLGRAHSARWPG